MQVFREQRQLPLLFISVLHSEPIVYYFCWYNKLTMQLDDLYSKALQLDMLTIEEGMTLFEQAPLPT